MEEGFMEKESLTGSLQIRKVNKWYPGNVHAVIDMDMEIKEGEFIVFVGPSGCGKTTLLRMIAGLENISGGEIILDGRSMNKVPPKNRDVAMVFQNYALYPNMKVKDNIAFPPKMRHSGKKEIKSRVAEVAQKLELDTLLERKPGALSGGQRQRVALARSMVRKPKLFLMDEPLANLDARLRTEMRREIITLQRELGVTTIYVTHDQTEAMTMGTRIAVINEGVLQQLGTPQEVYGHPANVFVAGFIGSPHMNLWDTGLVTEQGCCYLTLGERRIPVNEDKLPKEPVQGEITAGIRPEHIKPASPGEPGAIRMEINIVENTGRETAVFLSAPGMPDLTMITGADYSGMPGQAVYISLLSEKIHLFHKETGRAFCHCQG
ncbi:ABC transporter, ATP-binding protein [Clostridium sp. KLE 1755]|nr:ABC transporter, ATP-binding protein [Clostridium sp. KLE 1755]